MNIISVHITERVLGRRSPKTAKRSPPKIPEIKIAWGRWKSFMSSYKYIVPRVKAKVFQMSTAVKTPLLSCKYPENFVKNGKILT